MRREVESYAHYTKMKLTKCTKHLEKILNGERKLEVCEWWLSHIEQKADEFLQECGYDLDALPTDYMNTPPSSLAKVEENLKILVENMEQISESLDNFVEKTTAEVYVVLDELLVEMTYVLGCKWVGMSLPLQYSEERLKALERDRDYLLEMKQMDNEIKKKREDGKTEGTGLEMTEVVPVAGLIMARFHIYECECATVLELWKSKDKKTGHFFYFTFLFLLIFLKLIFKNSENELLFFI